MGSYIFFAPEMFMSKKSNVKVRGEKTDIWALGITMFYMLTGQYPFGKPTDLFDLKAKVEGNQFNYHLIKNIDTRTILQKLLEHDQNKRATLDQILESNWVTNNGKEKIEVSNIECDHIDKEGKK